MYAVLVTGSKQYRGSAGDTLEVDRLAVDAGQAVNFDRVLLVNNDGKVTVGAPTVTGATVTAEVVAFTVVSLGLLVLSAFFLSPPCRYLWPIPVIAFVVYPFTKRFTWTCHWVLGLVDGLAPAAAWVAVAGSVSWTPVLLFLAVGVDAFLS